MENAIMEIKRDIYLNNGILNIGILDFLLDDSIV